MPQLIHPLQRLRILGMDPGLNHTGYGVIDVLGSHFEFVRAGVINVAKGELSQRLGTIVRELSAVIEETQPTHAAAERVFVNINPQSTLMLGQARGAALVAADLAGLSVLEFTPNEIKQAVTGSGRADKIQMQTMVVRLLSLSETPTSDAADALACAICAANTMKLTAIQKLGETRRTYGTARRGRGLSGRATRSAWTALMLKQKD